MFDLFFSVDLRREIYRQRREVHQPISRFFFCCAPVSGKTQPIFFVKNSLFLKNLNPLEKLYCFLFYMNFARCHNKNYIYISCGELIRMEMGNIPLYPSRRGPHVSERREYGIKEVGFSFFLLLSCGKGAKVGRGRPPRLIAIFSFYLRRSRQVIER